MILEAVCGKGGGRYCTCPQGGKLGGLPVGVTYSTQGLGLPPWIWVWPEVVIVDPAAIPGRF